ncbi:MAG: hypothetical protein M3P26_17235, partial [Gemmatimonadota bacterium]|nr:hypothetical protein [Gemmatimonadota bacterium]
AVRIAAARGIALKSIVLPRNQYNPAYEQILLDAGITAYRGNQPGWIYRPVAQRENNRFVRAARLLDNYGDLVRNSGSSWDGLLNPNGMCNIPASFFLRPFSPSLARLEKLRYARITRTIGLAAERGRLVHIWWHPHNFGVNQENNLSFLRNILEYFSLMREQHGMRSLTMSEAGALARKHVSHN